MVRWRGEFKIVMPVLSVSPSFAGRARVHPATWSPDPVCAEPGAPTSGFVAEDDPNCAITIENYNEIRDYETSPKLFRIAGLLLVLSGLVVGVVGLVLRRHESAVTHRRQKRNTRSRDDGVWPPIQPAKSEASASAPASST